LYQIAFYLDFKVELLKLWVCYLSCRKIEGTGNISAFVPGFFLGFISECTACPLGQMPISAVQLDKILPAEKGEKSK